MENTIIKQKEVFNELKKDMDSSMPLPNIRLDEDVLSVNDTSIECMICSHIKNKSFYRAINRKAGGLLLICPRCRTVGYNEQLRWHLENEYEYVSDADSIAKIGTITLPLANTIREATQ